MNTNKDVILKKVEKYCNDSGNLVVFDYEKDLNKDIKRSFLVNCTKETIRGRHAHKKLNQFLVCISGICRVIYKDGIAKGEVILENPNQILKIPNQIWAEQHYLKNTSLLVMCDDIYREEDYIRDYKLFIDFRNNLNKK